MPASEDLDLIHHGHRYERLSGRFSEQEVALMKQLAEHAATDVSVWFRWALMTIVYERLPQENALPVMKASILTFKGLAKTLGPTKQVFHVRYPIVIRQRLAPIFTYMPDLKPGTFLRWVLAEYAPRTLEAPSRAQLDAAADEKLQHLREEAKKRPPTPDWKVL